MKKIIYTLCLFAFAVNVDAQVTPPYYEDFESGSSAWTDSTISGSIWTVGIPVGATAHVGSYVASVGYNGSNYANNTESYFTSPTFDFTGISNPYISFWKYHVVENAWDGVRIDFSVDNGLTWTVLGDVGSGANWYNDSTLNASNLAGWSGTDTSWKNAVINIPAFANSPSGKLRFVFTSDASVNLPGFIIDDIFIGEGTGNWMFASQSYSAPCGAQLVDFNLWGFGTTFGGTTTATINFGDGTDTTFQFVAINNTYNLNASHYYSSSGTYSMQYILTDSTGASDTLIQYSVVNISSNCGNISGMAYNDNNNDCIFNAGDSAIANFPVLLILSNGQSFTTFTDTTGNYFFQGSIGSSYTVRSGYYAMLGYNSICPASGQYAVSSVPSTGNDFAVYCAPGFDLRAYLWSWGFVPGQMSVLHASINNISCQNLTGTFDVVLDSRLSYISATPPPALINGNTLTWNYSALLGSFQNAYINALVDTTVTIGDTICNSISALPVAGDTNPANNTFNLCRDAATSVDPNEKTVSPEGFIAASTDLLYTVFFQNTGTAPAYNIHIFDTLDANLDVNTFRVIANSHPMVTDILPGNRLHFGFNNILLPDSNVNEPASHGYVTYTIKPLATAANGTVINNTAYIYFDFNSAIVTNTTFNQIDLGLSINDTDNSSLLNIYPNPANDFLTISHTDFKNADCGLKVYDMMGKEIYADLMKTSNLKLQTSNLSSGIYFVELKSGKVVYRRKFVKQ